MALPARLSGLTDELISVIADAPERNTPRFRRLKKPVEKTLRYDTSLRTNTFEIADRLDGLQRKFRIIGNDSLADALRLRLDELNGKRYRWAPDVLSLFLELSGRPATHSKVDSVEIAPRSPPKQAEPLKWADLKTSDTFGGEEDIWQDIDFSVETSDDTISLASSDVSIPRIVPHPSKAPADEYTPPDDLFLSVEDEGLIYHLRQMQAFDQPSSSGTILITELQAVRDVIFMLQGLPTDLFTEHYGTVGIDRRFTLHHLRHSTFISVLQSFSAVGTCIYRLRTFLRKHQFTPFMQTFKSELEHYVSALDRHLSDIHGNSLKGAGTVRVSMIQLLDNIQHETKFLTQLGELVEKLEPRGHGEPFQCLNMLYDLVCSKQASGEDQGFKLALELFIKCFEVYMKPIRLWMEKGELPPAREEFFVTEAEQASDPRTLWHDWFVLGNASGTCSAPKFLQPAVRKIFTTGKSVLFLHHLGLVPDTLSLKSTTLIGDANHSIGDRETLVPFSEQLRDVFDRLVNERHMAASSLLRTQLDSQCGLWVSLQALECIYLGKDSSRTALTDSKIFSLVDRSSQSWNDRFLLTDLVQRAFADLRCVDSSRLVVRSRKLTHDDFVRRRRSVKILDALSVDYVLPWPVANIITKESLRSYQRLSTFLMQIRRPRYLLERPYSLRQISTLRDGKVRADKLAFCIRYRLLHFLNALYSHITEVVVACSSTAMLRDLASAVDVDDMVSVHSAYIRSLEAQCLLSNQTHETYDAVMSILDLSIQFSDILDSRLTQMQSAGVSLSHGSSADRGHKSRDRNYSLDGEVGYAADEDAMEAEDNDVDEGSTTNFSFYETHYKTRLLDIKVELDRLCAFVSAGLRREGRSEGQQSWEILADKLEWKREGLSRV